MTDTGKYRDKSYGSKAKENMAKKNGSHATFYFTNGDKYLGEWKNNRREGLCFIKTGKGTQNYDINGHQYMGEWKSDVRFGHGVLSAPLNLKSKRTSDSKMTKIYVGNWKDDRQDGLGTYFYNDSSCYEGLWSKGIQEGWGKMTYADEAIYEGEWYGGKRQGRGVHLLGMRLP